MVSSAISNNCKGGQTDPVVDAALCPFGPTMPILVDGVGPA